jgi:tripartite ATP-independent transporter DctP family solute receptor
MTVSDSPVNASRRAILRAAVAGGMAALAAPHVARAAVNKVRLAHAFPDESHFGQGARAFAEAVAAHPALNGVLAIDIHGRGELGDELSLLTDCTKGTLDLAIISNTVVGNLVKENGLLDAPYVFRDPAGARAALDGPVGAAFAERMRANKVNILAWAENGLRHITANKAIRTPADLKGLKLRVPQSDVMLNGLRALGADAAPLSFKQVHEALRTGQFEAEENAIVLIEASKFYEVQKFVNLTGHIYDPAGVFCSQDVLDDLTPPQREALAACAGKGGAATRAAATEAQEQGLKRLAAAGMTVVSDVDVAAMRAAARPFLEGLAATYDADLVHRLITAGA